LTLYFSTSLPPDARIGADRRALVHDGRHAGDQRAVDDVAVADHPADVRSGEHGLPLATLKDVLHRRGQRDGVAARVALHALGLAGGARGVEDVGRLGGLHPLARDVGVHVLGAQFGVVDVAAGDAGPALVQAAIDHQHFFRRELGQLAGFVQQVLVGHGLAAAHAGVAGDDQLGLGVVDARRQGTGCEATEHHRMDGADAGTGEDGEGGFGDHRHVDQDAVTAADAERLHDRGGAHHFGLQFGEGIALFFVGLGRDVDQGAIVGTLRGMAVHGVVAEIGLAADEPLGKRRPREVTYLLRRCLPVDQCRLLGPELVALINRALVKLRVFSHDDPRWFGVVRLECLDSSGGDIDDDAPSGPPLDVVIESRRQVGKVLPHEPCCRHPGARCAGRMSVARCARLPRAGPSDNLQNRSRAG
jgi:hypothetical protein